MRYRAVLAVALVGTGALLLLAASGAVPVDPPRQVAGPVPRPAPTAPAPPEVPAAAPVRLVIAAAGIDIPVEVDVTAPGGVVEPARFDVPYWLSAYGVPGTDAGNTVYLAGHSSVEGTAIFDRLLDAEREPLDLTGEPVRLQTENGTLVYVFTAPAVKVPKAELPTDPDVWAVRPGRLVIFTCNRNDRAYNIVFTAELSAGIPEAER